MHELSVAQAIVESLGRHPAVAGGGRVAAVTVRVGALSGVVPAALSFAWEPATLDTFAAGSRLEIEEVGLAAWCPACEAERELATYPFPRLACPECGTPTPEIRRGRELEILSAEIEEGADPKPAEADAAAAGAVGSDKAGSSPGRKEPEG